MSDLTAQQEFAAALARFQSNLPKIGKDQTATVKSDKGSYTYDYADLALIQSITLPLLTAEGLSFSAKPTLSSDGFVLRYALRHSGGHEDGGDYPLPDPARSSPQQIGSAITYGRRYTFCAVTGVAPSGEDDDGQTAAESRAVAPKPAAKTDPRVGPLMGEIRKLRESLGMSSADVLADFSAYSGGAVITAADADTLSGYVAELRARAA